MTSDDGADFRARLREITIQTGASEAMADVIMNRIGARLAGHTHAEAVAMYPDPPADRVKGAEE